MGCRRLDPALRKLHEKAIEQCKTHGEYRTLLENSLEVVKTPPRPGSYHKPGVVEISGRGKYVFVGDLHGDYYTLLSALNSLWSRLEEYVVVFLGDYVDRGYMQLETLSLLLNLKQEYCGNVVLLRGNHEPSTWLTPYPHDYPHHLIARFGAGAEALYELSLELFESLPLALVHNNVLLALHGGPPLSVLSSKDWREAFEIGKNTISRKSLEEILWSDPVDSNIYYTPSPRGAGVLYGAAVSKGALQLINGKLIVRGHEAVNGFKVSHEGLVITVFTSPLVYGFECGGVATFEHYDEECVGRLTRYCIHPNTAEELNTL
ncbi:MAG: metallophosphoesterase family protein [Desulfurococcaceae archaeon]